MKRSLLICAYRSVEAETTECIHRTMADHKFKLYVVKNDALITRSRNIAVTTWYEETRDDVFLMVDGDIVFDAGDADRITTQAYRNKCVIGGMYTGRGRGPDGEGRLTSKLKPGVKVTFAPNAGLAEAEYVATGFLAVPRVLIDRMIRVVRQAHSPDGNFYCFFDSGADEHGNYLSEDWMFSQRVRDEGFSLYIDPTIRLGHIGTYTWMLSDLLPDPRKQEVITLVENTAPSSP